MEITKIIVDSEEFQIWEAWDHLTEIAQKNPGSFLHSEMEHINDCLVVSPDPTEDWERLYKAARRDWNFSAMEEITAFQKALDNAAWNFEDLRARGYTQDPYTGGWN